MKKYLVHLEFLYTDDVEVEAENEKDAEKAALDLSNEQYQKYLDCTVAEIKP